MWQKNLELYEIVIVLMNIIGQEEYCDFNIFQKMVDKVLKEFFYGKFFVLEKKVIFNVIIWYDEEVEKVVKKMQKFKDDKLEDFL